MNQTIPTRKHRNRRSPITYIMWLGIAALWLGFIYLSLSAFVYGGTDRYDFKAYYMGTEAMVDGGDLYNGVNGQVYLYPPLLAQLLAPVVVFGDEVSAAVCFFIINILALVSIPWMLARYAKPRWASLIWLGPIFFYPVLHAIYIGQVTIILAALLVATWTSIYEGQRQRAGMLLALAAWIKVWPAFLVIYFMLRRDWRVIRGVVVGGVGLLIFQVVLGGVDLMLDYIALLIELFTEGQYEQAQAIAGFQNLSIFGFASRLFQVEQPGMAIVISDSLFTLTRYGMLMVLFGMMLYAILQDRQDTDDNRQFDLEYAAVILVALLAGSTLWTTGIPPVYLCFFLALRHTKRIWVLISIMGSYLMLSFYYPMLIQFGSQPIPNSVYPTGMLVLIWLWGVLVAHDLMINKYEHMQQSQPTREVSA